MAGGSDEREDGRPRIRAGCDGRRGSSRLRALGLEPPDPGCEPAGWDVEIEAVGGVDMQRPHGRQPRRAAGWLPGSRTPPRKPTTTNRRHDRCRAPRATGIAAATPSRPAARSMPGHAGHVGNRHAGCAATMPPAAIRTEPARKPCQRSVVRAITSTGPSTMPPGLLERVDAGRREGAPGRCRRPRPPPPGSQARAGPAADGRGRRGLQPGRRVEHAAGGEEGVGLVGGVGHDMKQGGGEGAQPALQHHEAHLGDRGEGQGPLDARLREHHQAAKQGRDGADHGQDVERRPARATTSGLSRITRKPPALMMPACIRAETGVGASIVSGSQLWKGTWADLVIAPSTSSRPIGRGAPGPRRPSAAGRRPGRRAWRSRRCRSVAEGQAEGRRAGSSRPAG